MTTFPQRLVLPEPLQTISKSGSNSSGGRGGCGDSKQTMKSKPSRNALKAARSIERDIRAAMYFRLKLDKPKDWSPELAEDIVARLAEMIDVAYEKQ